MDAQAIDVEGLKYILENPETVAQPNRKDTLDKQLNAIGWMALSGEKSALDYLLALRMPETFRFPGLPLRMDYLPGARGVIRDATREYYLQIFGHKIHLMNNPDHDFTIRILDGAIRKLQHTQGEIDVTLFDAPLQIQAYDPKAA